MQAISLEAGLCNEHMERQRPRVWPQTSFEKPNFQNHSSFDGTCLSTIVMKYSTFLLHLYSTSSI